MKYLFLLFICLAFSTALMARTDIDLSSFNKQLIENMNEVIEDNPEIYEAQNPGRVPASVKPVEIDTTDKLDNFQEQANGQKSW
jgi:hypothetical protein